MIKGFDFAQEQYDRQEPQYGEPVGQCSICGRDIFEGESICIVDNEMICSGCFEVAEATKDGPPDEY